MTQETKRRHFDLIREAINLDLEEVGIWKRTTDRNTKFAQENVKLAESGIKTLIEIKRRIL